MSERKYYVICDDNCKFPAMTKEQTLAAIQQAVSMGEIKDVDTGFVTTLKTINGHGLKFFIGEQSEWDNVPDEQKTGVFAIITNDTIKDDMQSAITTLQLTLQSLLEDLADGSLVVKSAVYAITAGNATNATNSQNAVNAQNATNSQSASKTDFSNSEWTHVAYNGQAQIELGGVYQIRIKMYPTPLQYVEGIVTAEADSRITIGTRVSGDSSAKYVDLEMCYALIANATMSVKVNKYEVGLTSQQVTISDINTYYGWDYRRIK